MLNLETEDILPRTAPKPTVGVLLIETTPKPTVPEVSILFSQSTSDKPCVGEIETRKNYSSWKTTLPKAIYQASVEKNSNDFANSLTMENVATKRSNVYPLRTTSVSNIPCSKSYQCLESDKPTYCHTRATFTVNRCKQTPAQHQDKCILGTYPQLGLEQLQTALDTHCLQSKIQTICSSTQTDSECFPFSYNMSDPQKLFTNLPTKQDYHELLDIIQNMRTEQQRLMQICITLLEHECEREQKNNILQEGNMELIESVQDDIVNEPSTANQHKKGLTKNALNQSSNPDAHSTKYRPNTPLATFDQQPVQPHNIGVQKSITERSIVMNELALKYLPSDKLTDLLHDKHISPTLMQKGFVRDNACLSLTTKLTNSQRNGDIFDKGSSDISNASYTYLKKYRLLLEEHVSPIHQQNQSSCKHMGSSPPKTQEFTSLENILDLNAIKKQPKYL